MIVFEVIDFIFVFVIIIVLLLFILMFKKNKSNHNYPTYREVDTAKFAVIVPARDESKVIERLLISIKEQSFKIDMRDVYVIVEDEKDLTCDIASKYNSNVIVRRKPILKRKGYALDEGFKYILNKNKKYDAYFIFDADNILDKDYFKNMFDTYKKGYDIGVGYRNTKNGNYNAVSSCSTLTFSMINTIGNLQKNRDSRNVTISGTGFYIRGKFIEDWNGYPFHTLTEDYELTLYSSLNEMTSFYNENAIFYDEQPTSFSVSIKQRTRWVKGFFDVRKLYVRKLYAEYKKKGKNSGSQFSNWIGIKPYLLLAGAFFLELISRLVGALYYLPKNILLFYKFFGEFLLLFFVCYMVLFIATIMMINMENKKLNLNITSKIKAVLFNPIFLISYVYCLVKAFIHKDLEWKKIEHGN